MNIVEEYLLRNNLNYQPIVQHTTSSFFISRPKIVNDASNYKIISIKWIDKNKGPGNYHIQVSTFNKFLLDWKSLLKSGSYLDGQLSNMFSVFNTSVCQTVEYDEYEKFVYHIFHKILDQSAFLVTPKEYREALLMLWEAYVCIFDSYFKEQTSDIKEFLWNTLNTENSHETRIRNMDHILQNLYSNFYSLYYVWNIDMLGMANKYATWMHDLYNNLQIDKQLMNQ